MEIQRIANFSTEEFEALVVTGKIFKELLAQFESGEVTALDQKSSEIAIALTNLLDQVKSHIA